MQFINVRFTNKYGNEDIKELMEYCRKYSNHTETEKALNRCSCILQAAVLIDGMIEKETEPVGPELGTLIAMRNHIKEVVFNGCLDAWKGQ